MSFWTSAFETSLNSPFFPERLATRDFSRADCRKRDGHLVAALTSSAWRPAVKNERAALVFALDLSRKQSVCGRHKPEAVNRFGLLPASAVWPPRGCGGGSAMSVLAVKTEESRNGQE